MNISEKIEEKKINNKLIQLYKTLARSDLKGSMATPNPAKHLYAMYCLDLVNKGKMPLKEEDYITLGYELMRVDETDLFGWDYSLTTWANTLMCYMNDSKISADEIKAMNSFDLKKKLHHYIEESE